MQDVLKGKSNFKHNLNGINKWVESLKIAYDQLKNEAMNIGKPITATEFGSFLKNK